MPKVTQSYRNARRRQIMDAAIICFSREGFHRATMQDVVKQSKLSPGAIYNYFKSKEEIIEAIAAERHDRERVVLTLARNEGAVAPVLRQIRDTFFGELRNPKERLRRRVSIQLWAEAQRNPRILRLVRAGVDAPRKLLAAILSDAQRRGEISRKINPDATARFLIAAFHGLVLQFEWDNRVEMKPQVELLEAFLASISSSS
ncbi:MAG TPA: TetR/AcrR family transcriptional regulator [Candidatus Saccharimonadales bacterium]|nr:TetR/AcrR family transcriptional regulator [Candidatus Saccharimonadales bacterium]